MSDPKKQEEQGDDLDLDAETVRDLELKDNEADAVRGGSIIDCATRKPAGEQ